LVAFEVDTGRYILTPFFLSNPPPRSMGDHALALDRITNALLGEFSRENQLESRSEEARFEHFASYLAVSRHLSETIDTDDLVTGSGGDTGIDAIATIVNGTLVTDAELVQELANTNNYLDVTFVFVQAERSPSFEATKIGTFGFGVLDFFKDLPKLPRNTAVRDAATIMNAVYSLSPKFTRGNPACRLYYVTTGKWMDDANLLARQQGVKEDLQNQRLFRDVEFIDLDANAIQRLYNQTKNAISRDFSFTARTVIPEMPGVEEAYLGLLPASEFLSLIQDDRGNLVKSIFYENVRDWQDYNLVNSEIKASLESSPLKARFALMNNGVTIIAKTLKPTGNRFHIEDYQIVNGCQTSHVLFDQKSNIDDSVMIPLRLIATQNEDVIASIVKATNRQTQVKEEQLLALSDFPKKIESFFASFDEPHRLYYERRTRQYNTVTGIEKTRIITMPNLIRAYASVILEEPHRTTRNFRALLDKVGKEIFGAEHRLEPYYLSASALYRLEFLFRNGELESKFKPARYHLILAARLLATGQSPPRPNSHDMARYSDGLVSQFWEAELAKHLFSRAADIVNAAADGNLHRDTIRTQPFTQEVIKRCRQEVPAL
jgi:AIPR protein